MRIDLNADVGEGCSDDTALMPLITSASIACGGHAGDAASMRYTVEAAASKGVVIGAHVSYPDRQGFGRRELSLPLATITAEILAQLRALEAIASSSDARIRYVKAHGALYNRMADDAGISNAVIQVIRKFDASLALLTLSGSVAMECASSQGLKVFGEAFADRAYTAGSRLVPRTQPGAVMTDPAAVTRQAVALATSGKIASSEGAEISIRARSLCVHGDTPGAVTLVRAVRNALQDAGVSICAFV
jgi:5-oxoprolinase (ATP-hydrolysing) subunit A